MTAVFELPLFWHAYLECHLRWGIEQHGGSEILDAALHVESGASLAWSDHFTGSYSGIFEKADGYSDSPGIVGVPLLGGASLTLEWHPGDTVLWLDSPAGPKLKLGSGGPHWELPALRLVEVLSWLERGASSETGRAVLFMLPWAGITADGDYEELAKRLPSILESCDLFGAGDILSLSSWLLSMLPRFPEAAWSRSPYGWTTTESNSRRSSATTPETIRQIDKSLMRAGLLPG